MPIWRCPHCGTPQEESSRCWVCHRSTTSCATCRHFRRGVASGLGTCGLDPRHPALRGTEMRACWTVPEPEAIGRGERARVAPVAPQPDELPAPRRTFVPVDVAGTTPGPERPAAVTPAAVTPAAVSPAGVERRGWSLWGDAEG